MIAVPYHENHRAQRVGLGPLRIVDALERPDCDFVELGSEPGDRWTDIGKLNADLADRVARTPGAPLVIAGSCNCAIGVLGGLCHRLPSWRTGVVWFDAHGDFNTPQTSLSGAPDGMALACAAGDCLKSLRDECGWPQPIAPENVILVGIRDLDPQECVRLKSSRVRHVCAGHFAAALDELAPRVNAIYLHIDLDVLDPAVSPGVNCETPGGISKGQLFECVSAVRQCKPLAASTIANYNPERDRSDRTLRIAVELAEMLR